MCCVPTWPAFFRTWSTLTRKALSSSWQIDFLAAPTEADNVRSSSHFKLHLRALGAAANASDSNAQTTRAGRNWGSRRGSWRRPGVATRRAFPDLWRKRKYFPGKYRRHRVHSFGKIEHPYLPSFSPSFSCLYSFLLFFLWFLQRLPKLCKL